MNLNINELYNKLHSLESQKSFIEQEIAKVAQEIEKLSPFSKEDLMKISGA